ncbi:MAB_1171c family putative transporter [Nocardia mexicana]|uniref:DUF6545 domain-containing protein n=1 Tax=Nocardia mexicana TaxID=279262 RepID=A0A370HBW4_9NOCA|nr:MAB_1171c family putative transporter [Nocardia mexicana]RDI54197.1 hypothetical protein DFR68_102321 [Nocardia mexicana]
MTSSVPAAVAWPILGVSAVVLLLRWLWFSGSPVERYLNGGLTVVLLTQLLREDAVQRAVSGRTGLNVGSIQQLSLATIVCSMVPLLCVVGLLSGMSPKAVGRQRNVLSGLTALSLAVMLVAGTRARRADLPIYVSGGWDGVLFWVAFSAVQLVFAWVAIRQCLVEFRRPGAPRGVRVVAVFLAVVVTIIGVQVWLEPVFALLQEVRVVDSLGYRLRAEAQNYFWSATAGFAVSMVPMATAFTRYLGWDATTRRWRRLSVLWQAMIALFPGSRLPLDTGRRMRGVTTLQLQRATVEIRDGLLELRPYCTAVDPARLAEFLAYEKVPRSERESAEWALQLATAARDRARSSNPPSAAGVPQPVSSAANLDDEVAELLRLTEWWPAAERFVANKGNGVPGGTPAATSSSRGDPVGRP